MSHVAPDGARGQLKRGGYKHQVPPGLFKQALITSPGCGLVARTAGRSVFTSRQGGLAAGVNEPGRVGYTCRL